MVPSTLASRPPADRPGTPRLITAPARARFAAPAALRCRPGRTRDEALADLGGSLHALCTVASGCNVGCATAAHGPEIGSTRCRGPLERLWSAGGPRHSLAAHEHGQLVSPYRGSVRMARVLLFSIDARRGGMTFEPEAHQGGGSDRGPRTGSGSPESSWLDRATADRDGGGAHRHSFKPGAPSELTQAPRPRPPPAEQGHPRSAARQQSAGRLNGLSRCRVDRRRCSGKRRNDAGART